MDIEERLYECGEMYQRLPPEKRDAALKALNSIEGARLDLERRIDKWMRAAERDIRDSEG